ncbi:sigma-E processing peptidase SpoIIGA [uncultured Clostridium sp.]|uniref:sigma-E processing peptidase SpoIIGA n=1 Tax=uncultured Clostridium sp. TaxID=59620 RepID=UPI0025E59312|nr:sigma-E processing peptidase SpoIIGA [uncultured Clostridium sp.]
MAVYADIYFLENFIVNIFLLSVTMRCLKHKYSIRILLEAGFIGAMYSLVLLIPKLKFFSILPFELLVAYLMLRIVYGKTNLINTIKAVCIFFMSTFTLSGICFLFSLKQNYYVYGSYKIEKYSIKYIIIGIMIIFIFLDRMTEYIKDRTAVSNYIYMIEFQVKGKKYNLQSFLDTGNELREPITNLPCILAEEKFFSQKNFSDENVYYISYNAIGYEGRLKGIRVNNIKIKCGKLEWRNIDAVVCPCKEKLSRENDFNALLSRGVL